MDKYLKLYKKNKDYRILLSVVVISQFGSWFSQTGIFTLLTQINAPIWAISLTASMNFLPSVILAPFMGTIIETHKKIILLRIFITIETIAVFMLLFISSMSDFYFLQILIFFRMGAAASYFQTEMAFLPKILNNEEDLKTANELHSMVWSACYTLGMAISGVVIYLFGVKFSFVIDFILFLIGGALLTKVKFDEVLEIKNSRIFAMIKEGFLYMISKKILFHKILLHSLIGVTSYDALITLLSEYKYKTIISVSLSIGLMNSTRAIGLAIGPVILSKFANKKQIPLLFVGQFLGILSWVLLQFNFYLALIGLFFTGLFTTTLWSYTFTQIQLSCDKSFHGRVIAWIDTMFLGFSVIVSFLIGKFYELGISLNMITLSIGIVMLLSSIYSLYIERKE